MYEPPINLANNNQASNTPSMKGSQLVFSVQLLMFREQFIVVITICTAYHKLASSGLQLCLTYDMASWVTVDKILRLSYDMTVRTTCDVIVTVISAWNSVMSLIVLSDVYDIIVRTTCVIVTVISAWNSVMSMVVLSTVYDMIVYWAMYEIRVTLSVYDMIVLSLINTW